MCFRRGIERQTRKHWLDHSCSIVCHAGRHTIEGCDCSGEDGEEIHQDVIGLKRFIYKGGLDRVDWLSSEERRLRGDMIEKIHYEGGR